MKFDIFSLIISSVMISVLSLKLGIVFSDWVVPSSDFNEFNLMQLSIFKIIIAAIGVGGFSVILIRLNILLFKVTSERGKGFLACERS